MIDRYILDDEGNPVPCENLVEWANWLENAKNRVLAADEVEEGVKVSTVFLGLDHAFGGTTPVLWETMIFGGEQNEYQERYTSREAALEGHAQAIKLAKGEPVERRSE